MDWQKEFKYLETRHTIPSADDVWNSLRTGGMEKHLAAGVAELALVAFRRIAQVEQDIALLRRQVP